MKILLPVDGSAYTRRMLAYLAAHDELVAADSEHVFLTVVSDLPLIASNAIPPSQMDLYYAESAEAVFRPIRAFAEQQRWPMRLEAVRGHPATEIADFATREKVDLIVMGSHGHAALSALVMGSVANGVLARCRTPLLLIR